MILDYVGRNNVVRSKERRLVDEALWPDTGDPQAKVQVGNTFAVPERNDLIACGVRNFNDGRSGIAHVDQMVPVQDQLAIRSINGSVQGCWS